MRDSRIGAYGAIALALALILRVGALAAALDGGFWRARSEPDAGRRALPRRRADAARASAASPRRRRGRCGGPCSTRARSPPPGARRSSLRVALGLVALGLAHALLAALMSGAGALLMVALARRAIGGQTGDVAGAAQQCAEIAAWCGLLIGHIAA